MEEEAAGLRWWLDLPAGFYAVRVDPPPECRTMVHLRGELAPGAPAFGVVTTQARGGHSAHARALELAGSFVRPCAPRRLSVPGGRAAARVDGSIDMEEGLTADGIERIAVVVVELRELLLVVTIRTRPEDEVGEGVDSLLASLRVEPAADRPSAA